MATARQAPAPQPSRRRREETGRAAFTKAARKIMRRAARLPPKEAYAPATMFLADTLDWLELWQGNDATGSSDLNGGNYTPSPSIAPHL